jgi:hypothetical protein
VQVQQAMEEKSIQFLKQGSEIYQSPEAREAKLQ